VPAASGHSTLSLPPLLPKPAGLIAGEEIKAIQDEISDKRETLLQTAQWQAPRAPRVPRPRRRGMRRAASAAAAEVRSPGAGGAPAGEEGGDAASKPGTPLPKQLVRRMATYTAPLRAGRLAAGDLLGSVAPSEACESDPGV
jgi:hypothetical protein